MFAKLKQKIQEEGADLTKGFIPPSVSSPVNNGSCTTPNLSGSAETTPVKNTYSPSQKRRLPSKSRPSRGSSDSLNDSSAISTSPNKEFSITDSPGTPVKKTSENERELDDRVKELTKAFAAERKQREKVQHALEKQQDKFRKRLEEIEHEYKFKLENTEKEKSDLAAQVLEASLWKDKYLRDHEAAEELEGFQTQELAKIKHLLLLSQQDLQQNTVKLKQKESALEDCKQVSSSLEEEILRLKWKCEKFEEESAKIKDQSVKDTESIKELKEMKESLGKKVVELSWQLEQDGSKCSQIEKMLSDLQNEYDTLQHNHEIYTSKNEALLEKRETTISYLEERVQTLERRLASSELGDDERLKALSTERDNLEVKLEESRQHLNEVKTNWSDTITTLEKQIANLNKKMAEDREEESKREEQVEIEKSRLNLRVVELGQQLEDSHSHNHYVAHKLESTEEELKKQKAGLRQEIEKAYHDKEEATRLLEERIHNFEERHMAMQKERDDEVVKYQSKIAQLESKNTEHLSKENDLEKHINKLLEERGKLEKNLESTESKMHEIESMLEESKQLVETLTKEVNDVNNSLKVKTNLEISLRQRIEELEVALQTASTDKEELQMKNDSLLSDLDNLNSEIELHQQERQKDLEIANQKMEELKLQLTTTNEEQLNLQNTIAVLEKSLATDHIEGSDRVKELKSVICDLESQLNDKNKTIKLQQQRLSDMKKTLQRELKIQSPSLESNSLEPAEKDTLIPSQMPFSRLVEPSISSLVHDRPSSLSEKLDDINFRYIKHVILKFVTSREYEAQQLIKAIAVILDFTPEEEQLVKETLDWKMSWFGSKPQMNRPHIGNRTVVS